MKRSFNALIPHCTVKSQSVNYDETASRERCCADAGRSSKRRYGVVDDNLVKLQSGAPQKSPSRASFDVSNVIAANIILNACRWYQTWAVVKEYRMIYTFKIRTYIRSQHITTLQLPRARVRPPNHPRLLFVAHARHHSHLHRHPISLLPCWDRNERRGDRIKGP